MSLALRCPPFPLLAPAGQVMLPYLRSQLDWVMTMSGWRLQHPLVSDPWIYCYDFTDFDSSVFGMPILLKCKADKITVDTVPLPPQHSSPLPVTKRPRRNWELVDQMHGLLRMGAQ